jgi:PAS domain S-box-containing protein
MGRQGRRPVASRMNRPDREEADLADRQDQHPIRILIVEDEVIIGSDLKTRLEKLGYRVCGQVRTGQAALIAAERENPDLIFMDIVLKGPMDGIDAAELIRSRFDLPVIFVTAWADEERLARAKQTMPFGYLLKPFQDRDIKVTVEMAMYVSRADRERRLVEEELREREAKLSSIFSAAPVGIGIFAHRILLEANETLCRMLGYDREELIGLEAHLLYPEQADYDFVGREMYEQVESLGTGSAETRWRRKNGEIIQVGLKAAPLDPKNLSRGVTFTALNITERKQAEQALWESEQRFRQLVENAPLGILSLDRQGRLHDINPKLSEILGSPSQEETRRINMLSFDPLVKAGIAEHFRQCLDTGRPGLYEAPYTSKWGKDVVLRYHLQPIRDPAGRITGVQAIVEDISTARKLEEQLRQAQKMEAVGTLAGGVAHDFNNLLQAINGYAQLLLLDKQPGGPDYDELVGIQSAGMRAAQLVRQLLAFSRKMEGFRHPVDLNQSVIAAETILGRTIPKMIDIELQLGQNLYTVDGDPVQIEQVFLNLGSNAADAMPGGGRLTMATRNITLDEEFCRVNLGATPGDYVLLTVSDTGVGLDPDTIKHIFEPFFTTKSVGKGTGLGLASVYGIIKGHGGYITCHSLPGQGASFEIYFPAARTDKSQPETDRPQTTSSTGTETILLVDDESYVRDLASQILRRGGYSTLAVESGEKALETFRNHPETIDLVIMDLGMPGMGGLKCTRELLSLDPSLKIIIASGYGSEGLVEEALAAGAAGYVGKPYQLKELVAAVGTILDQRRK